MVKNHIKICLILIITAVLFTANLSAQSQNGKLTGKITDATTGEPLIGANIIINGTSLGASTDVKGNYIILRIPPAIYSVTISSLGYQKVTVKEVEINVDRTTELSYKLQDQSVQMEQVVVVAEKTKIIKDQTSTSSTISLEQIKSAPIEGIRGALDLSSSFQKTSTGNYSIRGSGAYEVNFQINGVEQINSSTNAPASTPGSEKANNSWKYDVNPLGVSQVQLISGGFSAEYGNAQAGVVKVVLREGTPKLTGEARIEYRPPGQYHFGDYLYSKNNYEWKKWGSLDNWFAPGTKDAVIRDLGLNTTQRYKWLYDRIKTETNPDTLNMLNSMLQSIENREITWAYNTWVRNHTPSDDNPLGVYDYTQYAYTRYLVGFGGPLGKDPNVLRFYFSGEYRSNPTRLPTPEKLQIYQNYILNLTWQPTTDHKIKLMTSYQKYRGGIWSGSDDIRWSGLMGVPSGSSTKYLVTVDPVRTEQTLSQSFNWVYSINTNSYLEATISHQQETIVLPYEFLISNTQQNDKVDSLYDMSGSILREGGWWETSYYRQPFNFSTNYYQDSRTNHWSASFDYTNQILKTNLIKSGFRFYYWDLFNNAVNSSFQANTYVARSGYAEFYHAYPINMAFYIQDKMEYEGMVANLGVRAEAFNFQSNVAEDIFNPFYPGKDGPKRPADPYGNPDTKPSETQFIILPRLGLSFPIGENTAFRIQYGHFASMPTFAQGLSQRTDRGWIVRGNPNLKYKKTINYEFGLQQMLNETHRLDLALYYNDRVSQVGIQRVAAYTGTLGSSPYYNNLNEALYSYTTYDNNAFGSTLGFEVTLEKIAVGEWGYRLSYSLSQTKEGNYGTEYLFPDNTTISQRSFTDEYLSPSDRTHSFRGLIQYSVPEDDESFLGRIFASTVFSLTYTAQSGLPYTYVTDFTLVKDVRYNRRYPIESSFDFNAVKNLTFAGFKFIVGLRVMNLFNNKWITPISDVDFLNWVNEGTTMDNAADDPTRKGYVIAPFKAYRNIPRQVFLTVGIGF